MAKVKGMSKVLSNLNKEIQGIEGRSLKGLRRAALFVQGESQEVVPQDLGVLINSAFSGAEMTPSGPLGRVGYTAKYAPYVHEMPESYNFTKPGTGPKFLERPAKENGPTILSIIYNAAKL